MSDNMIPPSSDGSQGLGQTLHLASLAPVFNEDRHRLYFDLLMRAIDSEGTKNVALTGAYGTGKSSVLDKLNETRKSRIVALSLSTIAPEIHDASADESADQERAAPRTNQIQKEIVKQLLYRLPPGAVPRSRFHRASAPDKARDWRVAGWAGAGAFVVLFGLGLAQPFVEGLLSQLWRQVAAYILLLGLFVCTAWAVTTAVRARLVMSASVQTGPATITLSKQSDSYFDEYLDEIVYFFQASKRDIVVIEDIDRFEDVQVFDTLRALNGLLNTSAQIGRRIVFVYAIRDSVFEQIGAGRDAGDVETGSTEQGVDRAKAALKRASRTKFFDVIIPVVPFVSADNARDVMSDAMESNDFDIDPALIRLAARHVADMRMIHNIRNEFEVYRSRLVVPKERIHGITDDLVLAIILFKNTHLADFEKIRHRESTLDRLYLVWRSLVRQNLDERSRQLAELKRSRHLEATSSARAVSLGHRLTWLRDTIQDAARETTPRAVVELDGPAAVANVADPDTWSQISSSGSQRMTLQNPASPYTAVTLSFSLQQLADLAGINVEPAEWEVATLRGTDQKIADAESDIRFLRHHTWAELWSRREFVVDIGPFALKDSEGEPVEGPTAFADAVEAVLESDLARELVRHDFLTSHFALYASSYYGNHLGPEAMEYIRRCIEPGTPDATFAIDDGQVVQLLREQGADKRDDATLFSDASVFNVSIVNYLLLERPAAVATIALRLSQLDDEAREFIDIYMSQGEHPGGLLAALAPHWAGAARYAAEKAPVDPATRPALLDAIFGALPVDGCDADEVVGQILETSYRDMATVSHPASRDRADIVMRVVQQSGGKLESLEPLNAAARESAIRYRVFPITEENLRVLAGSDVVALDAMASDEQAYGYVLDRIEEYLVLVGSSPNVETVVDPSMFATILNDVAERSTSALLGQFIGASAAVHHIADLGDVAPETWPFLAAINRTDPTVENVSAYLETFGMDSKLGLLLNKHKKISRAERLSAEARLKIATAILAASAEIPSTSTRVRIAASLQPGMIEATNLVPESGDLVSRLLKRKLLIDDADAFSDELMVDWTTLEKSIAASRNVSSFVSPDVLKVSWVPSFLRSSALSNKVKLAVVSDLPEYLADANTQEARAITVALIETRWQLSYKILEALRAAGAFDSQLIELVALRGGKLAIDDLKSLLQAMGGDYARIATGGRGRPKFRTDPAHEYVLNRLIGDTIRRVETETFKLWGRKLVAPLL